MQLLGFDLLTVALIFFCGILLLSIIVRLYMKYTCGQFISDQRMDGKTVIVTGSNSGIGKETAKDLARRGARVIMACRNMETAKEARDEIVTETGNNDVHVLKVDLSSQQSVRNFSAEVHKMESKIDVLIHNAGYAGFLKRYTGTDGIELTMATNYYGPFLLTHLLIDLLQKAAPSRVVVVSSIFYNLTTINAEIVNPSGYVIPVYMYCKSKFANVLFTLELADRLKGTGITANCLQPGTIRTGIWRNIPFPLNICFAPVKMFFKTIEEGARTTLYAAIAPELEEVSGKFFSECKEISLNKRVQDKARRERFWEGSRNMVGLKLEDTQNMMIIHQSTTTLNEVLKC